MLIFNYVPIHLVSDGFLAAVAAIRAPASVVSGFAADEDAALLACRESAANREPLANNRFSRPPAASAPASLRLPAAPEAWR